MPAGGLWLIRAREATRKANIEHQLRLYRLAIRPAVLWRPLIVSPLITLILRILIDQDL